MNIVCYEPSVTNALTTDRKTYKQTELCFIYSKQSYFAKIFADFIKYFSVYTFTQKKNNINSKQFVHLNSKQSFKSVSKENFLNITKN